MSDTDARELPTDIEAEMALLGALLVNPNAFDRVCDTLTGADNFADLAHQRIYAAIAREAEAGRHATASLLRREFESDDSLKNLGGARYLAELAAGAANVIDAVDYARLITDLAKRRRLIDIANQALSAAYGADPEDEADDLIEGVEQSLLLMAENRQAGGFVDFSTILERSMRAADSAYRNRGRVTGTPTGLACLDDAFGGLQKTDLIVLAGRPSMGKSALAQNIAEAAARSRDIETGEQMHVGFFSLEMAAKQIGFRALATESGIPANRVMRGQIDQRDFDATAEAGYRLESLGLHVDDTPGLTVAQIRNRARRLKRKTKRLDLIVVDYLQKMGVPRGSRNGNRTQDVSDMTNGLKDIAKELGVPVLALSQLSRAVEQREDKRPQLADLRDSGSIEQDADIVMFVYREEYYLSKAEPQDGTPEHDAWQSDMQRAAGGAEIIVAKYRNGPTSSHRVIFDGARTRFHQGGDAHPSGQGGLA